MQRSIVENHNLHLCTEVQVFRIGQGPIRPPWTFI